MDRIPSLLLKPRPAIGPAARTRLDVVIVNFCQWRNTARLVKQLRHSDALRDGSAAITLVDNGSPRHKLADRLARLKGVTLLANRRNLGFAKAVNRGVLATHGDWVLLLNPDVTVEDGFLDRALTLIDDLPTASRVGAVGFQLRNSDGSPQASTGRFPTLIRIAWGLLRPRDRRRCQHQSLVERDPVDWATGGCLLLSRACARDLGGFDERYFLYYEDVDFCRRAAHHGWQVLYDPRLAAVHHWPLHRRPVPAPLRLITRHALLTYANVHWPAPAARCLAAIVATEARLRHCLASFHGKSETAATYRDLAALVRHIRSGNRAAITRCIETAARTLRAVAAMQDRVDG